MTSPYFLRSTPTKECPRCLFDDTIAVINDHQCEYCHLHDKLEASSVHFGPVLKKIKRHRGKYNCLIGISGGADSSTLLYAAVKHWELRPLVIHLDNHYNVDAAKENMLNLIQKLNVDTITYMVNKSEYEGCCEAFLKAGVPDADATNDLVMTKLMYETAVKYNIKWICNGHNFRTEGSTPKLWTRLDGKYLASVYKRHCGRNLVNFPNLTFWDQIKYAFIGIKQTRPFHFSDVDYDGLLAEMEKEIGFKSYGGKHQENVYTDFVGSYLLPGKFGIDKRIVYLSAEVRSGRITKTDARMKLAQSTPFDTSRIPAKFTDLIDSRIGNRDDYDHYNFKKWKFVIWILWKLKVVPETFYVKSCH